MRRIQRTLERVMNIRLGHAEQLPQRDEGGHGLGEYVGPEDPRHDSGHGIGKVEDESVHRRVSDPLVEEPDEDRDHDHAGDLDEEQEDRHPEPLPEQRVREHGLEVAQSHEPHSRPVLSEQGEVSSVDNGICGHEDEERQKGEEKQIRPDRLEPPHVCLSAEPPEAALHHARRRIGWKRTFAPAAEKGAASGVSPRGSPMITVKI